MIKELDNALASLRMWESNRLLIEFIEGHGARMGVMSVQHQEAFDKFRGLMQVVIRHVADGTVTLQSINNILDMDLRLLSPVARDGQLYSEITLIYKNVHLGFPLGKLDTLDNEIASRKVRLHPIQGDDYSRFLCVIDGANCIVVPALTDDLPGAVPVWHDGVPYMMRCSSPEHSGNMRQLTLHVPDGPYKGFQGQPMTDQYIDIYLSVLHEYFSTVLWRRVPGRLDTKEFKGLADVKAAMKDGWTYQPEPEKIEDVEHLHVYKNGKLVVENNPFYVPPVVDIGEGV